jgi:hypothetical protein
MGEARKWWDSKKVELQKSIDEILEKSSGEDREIYELMKLMVENTRVKED